MQMHCGEHILSGRFFEMYGVENRGFHMGEDYMTIDMASKDGSPITEEMIRAAELAANATNIACIDHHRKTGEFVVVPKLTFIDPSASSACELVADMLEQSLPAGALSKDEAELMLAGIVLDTKKYEINTGTKTFGAAQYLKGEGADTAEVQQLFIDKFDDYRREAGFGAKVTVYRDKYAISINEQTDDDPSNRIAAAKAAVTDAERRLVMTTPCAPAHSALLITEPRLCGSSMPSNSTTKGGSPFSFA